MERETKKEFQNLGRMVKKGFDHVDKRFQGIDNRFEQARKDREKISQEMKDGFDRVNDEFAHVNARFDTLEKDIKSFVTRDEFEDLTSRVKYLETKLGVESGK